MKKEHRKSKLIERLKVIAIGISIVAIGFTAGFVGGKNIAIKGGSIKLGLLELVFIMFVFILIFMVQIILHELGHLIGGLLSGYEFVSFRVGTLTFIKEDNKILVKKFNIPGTAGQCLMMPKEDDYNKCPYILYNLGGILMNAIISILCIIIYIVYPYNSIINTFLITTITSGIIIVITNGVPMKIGGIANDGYNLISIGKNNITKYCLYMQLKVNGLIYKGIRIKDMPINWFQLEESVDLNNPMISSIKCLEANYYHDKKEFNKAKECYEDLLNNAPQIIKIYEYEIKCELLFYEIIGEKRDEIIDKLYTKELKRYIKSTNCYITRKRLMYAYTMIIEKDINKYNKILREIEVVKKTYPAKAEIESELEIIDYITNIKCI